MLPYIYIGAMTLAVLVQGQWIPLSQSKMYSLGQPTTVYTRGDKSYKEAWYTVQGRTQFVFSVKACSNAYVALTTQPLFETDFSLEIVLGAQQNSRSLIQYPFMMGASFDTYTPNLLHCNEYRTFWIMWLNNYIQVGRGPTVGEQIFMNTQDMPSHPILSIGLASAEGSAAVWQVNENSGEALILHTPDEHKYESMWKSVVDRQYWTFAVKSAGHVHLVLTEGQGEVSANVVEFVLGGWDNNRTVIRSAIYGYSDYTNIMATANTRNIVSADEYRYFWIGWVNGTMEIGKGPVFAQDRIIRWEDPRRLNIRYLAATTGFGETGEWIIFDSRESLNYIYTKPTDPSQPTRWYGATWLESPRAPFFAFTVRSCKQAAFLLSDNRAVDVERDIEIIIGDEDNTKTVIRYMEMFPPGNIAEADTPGILSCDQPRAFWFSWMNDTLTLGESHIHGAQIILSQKIGAGFFTRSIALATPADNGLWIIPDMFGERLQISTPDEFNHYDQLWRTIETKEYFTFQVIACSDVHVGLSPTPGIAVAEFYYDVIISGWNNQRTVIHRVEGGTDRAGVGSPVDTPDLLSCTQRRDLWLSWSDNVIKVGRGGLPGHHVLLEQTIDIMPVRAVSVSTGWGYTGDWFIENDNGDYMMYYTNSVINENTLGLSPQISWIMFRLRACSDAHIFLESSEDSGRSDVYEFVLGADNNQRSYIKIGAQEVASDSTPNRVSCLDNTPVWISWQNGIIQLGMDTIQGLNPILTYSGSVQPSMGLMHYRSTATDLNCRWSIYYNTAYWTSFKTPVDWGYHYVWETVEHRVALVFSIQACSDAHFVLSDVIRTTDQRYDIYIGGVQNSQSAIRMLGNRDYVIADTPGILSCTEMRSFWVTWASGAIEVGQGEVIGEARFLIFQPLFFYPVRAVGYSSGYGFNASWTIKLLDELLTPASPVTIVPTPHPDDIAAPSSGLSGGAVAGIIIGVLAGLMVIVLIVIMIRQSGTSLPSLTFTNPFADDTQPISPDNVAPEQADIDVEDPPSEA